MLLKLDSRIETYAHIQVVQGFLGRMIRRLTTRSELHDQSKLISPEVEAFDEFTSALKATTYGSDEYKARLATMKPALDHHYATNSHHPEHYRWHCPVCGGSFSGEESPQSDVGNDTKRWCPRCCHGGSVIWECELMNKPERGICGMTLLDLVEMICDWRAATMRHADGDIRRSIEINQKRFGYSDELRQIFLNTLSEIEDAS